jgi:hypothetical protein
VDTVSQQLDDKLAQLAAVAAPTMPSATDSSGLPVVDV